MTLAKAKAKANETFIVQVSLMIVTYACKNMFIVQATGRKKENKRGKKHLKFATKKKINGLSRNFGGKWF